MYNLKKSFLNWFDIEKSNKKRIGWGFFFLIFGGIFAMFGDNFYNPTDEILWAVGWSGIGIGFGLINERLKRAHEKPGGRDDQHFHYVMYYLVFALLVVSLAAYALAKNGDDDLNYPLSALVGLTIGFVARKINEIGPIKG